jgi:hypothetical protein
MTACRGIDRAVGGRPGFVLDHGIRHQHTASLAYEGLDQQVPEFFNAPATRRATPRCFGSLIVPKRSPRQRVRCARDSGREPRTPRKLTSEVHLGACGQPAAGRRAPLDPADDGEGVGVGERGGLEPRAEVAERRVGIPLAAADRHGRVQGPVVHAAAVVDDEEADEPVLVPEEAHHDVAGTGVDGVVDEVRDGGLEAVALVRQ